MKSKIKVMVGDFETTVYEGQTETEVWASALVELYSEDVTILHSIDETYEYLCNMDSNIRLYYHNLKFDGMFWLDYILRTLKYEQAFTDDNYVIKNYEMKNDTFKYMISDTGQVYSITIKVNGHIIELRDSYKLLPFSVKVIGDSFDTKHKKLDMKYEGYRYAGCAITDEEKKYISNDVLVVKEALEIMYAEGHSKLTIGSCCMGEYKQLAPFDRKDWTAFLPNLKEYELDESIYGSPNADAYIRKAYKGGWCYVNPVYQKQKLQKGFTLDVNSLYPSMMVSDRLFPVGEPHFWVGERPEITYENTGKPDKYFFIRVRVKFRIKKGKLPFIQMKHSFFYAKNQCLTTSNYVDKNGNEHEYLMKDGELVDCKLELTLTCTDYYLMLEHYDIYSLEVLDGCYFGVMSGSWLFRKYINKYKEIKMTSKGAKRQLAKLFLNNLYGKLATSDNSSFKYVTLKDDLLHFKTIPQFEKSVIYIPIGSAITSYAREFTIRSAQENYKIFVYADTDSIHCVGDVKDVKGVTIDDAEFSCWKHECDWDTGYFTRQKTYIEHVVSSKEPYYDVKCAGMNQRCKDLYLTSLLGEPYGSLKEDDDVLRDAEKEFLETRRTLNDFDVGLSIPSKLSPKRMKGGIVLVNTTFTMR